jgi:hypothetical protein
VLLDFERDEAPVGTVPWGSTQVGPAAAATSSGWLAAGFGHKQVGLDCSKLGFQ